MSNQTKKSCRAESWIPTSSDAHLGRKPGVLHTFLTHMGRVSLGVQPDAKAALFAAIFAAKFHIPLLGLQQAENWTR